ncbi:hypothetical protein C8J57DRAFT_1262531, partial [Mycena rebaudengoi]
LCTPTVYKCTRNIINGNLVTYAQDGWTNVAKTHVNISVISVENETHEMTRCPKTDHGLFFIVKNDFEMKSEDGAFGRLFPVPESVGINRRFRRQKKKSSPPPSSKYCLWENQGPQSQADILRWEFLIARKKFNEAFAFARSRHDRCRSPGGKGSDLTDFLREQLLHYTAIFAYHIAEDMLKGRAIEVRIQEVKNAISFINDSPPDADKMPRRIALTIHLNFLLRGHTLNDDFTELQASQNKLSLAYDIAQSRTRGFYPPPQCLAIDKYSLPIVSRHAGHTYPAVDDPNVNLAAWLKKLDNRRPYVQILRASRCAIRQWQNRASSAMSLLIVQFPECGS